MVLVIDDAQHADDSLLDFLDHLLGTAQAPVFVLALARPELLSHRPALGGRRATVVRLDPLDDVAMARLVDGLVAGLPERFPSSSRGTCRRDPALCGGDRSRPDRPRPGDSPRGTVRSRRHLHPRPGCDRAPASLQALVAARLDALAPEERALVTGASVLGASFTVDGLVALGADPQEVQSLLDSLRRKEIVTLQTDRFSAERGQYRFVQSVVRQVAYATQSRRDRTTRHLAAAEHLAALPDPGDDFAVVIARHLLDAVEWAPDQGPDSGVLAARACTYLERAAARARRVGAPGEAQRLLEMALDSIQRDADRARLHLSASEVADDAGHSAEAQAHGEAALDLFDRVHDPVGAARAAAAVAWAMWGNHAAAVAIAEPRWQALEGMAGGERARFELARGLSRGARRSWEPRGTDPLRRADGHPGRGAGRPGGLGDRTGLARHGVPRRRGQPRRHHPGRGIGSARTRA